MNADVPERLYMAAREQWPELELAFGPFERHCARVGNATWRDGEPVHAADLYLCCACLCGVTRAAAAFDREGAAVARAAVARINRDPEFVEEVVQELWQRLLVGPEAKLRSYTARGPLKGWLRVAATRAALDRVRAQKGAALRQTELSSELVAEGSSPEIRLIKARYGGDFRAAFKRALLALSARERNLLHMHLTGGCNIDQIGKAYDVHRATAARWLEQARSAIYRSVRRELRARYGDMTDSEFRSFARMIRSNLESGWLEQGVPTE